MSCYEQSLGKIILPAKEWSKFKKELDQKYQEHLKTLYSLSLDLHSLLLKAKKEKKLKDVSNFINELYESNYTFKNLSFHDYEMISKNVFNRKDNKILKPSKKDFTLKIQKKEDKIKKISVFYDDDLTVVLNHKEKMVEYHTDDNNHSVDHADNSFIGKTVLKMLDRVEYTNRTGGYFRYQSEYDKDENDFHTGSRITKRYGKYKNQKYLYAEKCDLF